jgi:AraC-like DNA-binding protein
MLTETLETDASGRTWVLAPVGRTDTTFSATDEFISPWPHGVIGVRCRLPVHVGRGTWDLLKVSPYVHMIIVDVEYLHDTAVTVPGDRFFKIRILLAGRMLQCASNTILDGTGAYLETLPGHTSSRYVITGGLPTKLVIISCLSELLSDRFGLASGEIPEAIRAPFDASSGPPVGGPMPLGPDVLRAANDILRTASQFSPTLLLPFLEAKSHEIVCSVLHQLASGGRTHRMGLKVSARDVSRLHEARDLLMDHFPRPPSIPDLARRIGINQTKLKASFKAVFGLTIYDFIQKCRMERASELVSNSQLSIAEVAYAVGFEYPANFTHAYKRYYGYLPRQVRRSQEVPGQD